MKTGRPTSTAVLVYLTTPCFKLVGVLHPFSELAMVIQQGLKVLYGVNKDTIKCVSEAEHEQSQIFRLNPSADVNVQHLTASFGHFTLCPVINSMYLQSEVSLHFQITFYRRWERTYFILKLKNTAVFQISAVHMWERKRFPLLCFVNELYIQSIFLEMQIWLWLHFFPLSSFPFPE